MQTTQRPGWRIAFRYLNTYFMVPAFRLRLGSLLVNPITGYIMVLKTIGARSGQIRYAPVNYTIINYRIYCVAGWVRATHWFANLRANPTLTLLLPGRVIAGRTGEVIDPSEANRARVKVARNACLPLLCDGLNPLTATAREIIAANGWMPMVRIRPARPLVGGPNDPGGCAWVLPTLTISTILLIWRRQRRSRGT